LLVRAIFVSRVSLDIIQRYKCLVRLVSLPLYRRETDETIRDVDLEGERDETVSRSNSEHDPSWFSEPGRVGTVNVCVNAGTDTAHQKRKTTLLGPRLGWWCVTCVRARNKANKTKTRTTYLEKTYGLSTEDVQAIRDEMPKNASGVPVCPICRRATGATKELAADHDHALERQGLPIRETIRGFLCGQCNYNLIGRYGIESLKRAIDYLEHPPAFRALGTHVDE
jgi:hypothetical protein